jgi:hypothetical protein
MSINIKEIFKSDLDPNSTNWWAKDKIDKLNFNFNQLKEGGMPGPFGLTGSSGITGNRGFQGTVGESGTTGLIGLEGAPGFSSWNVNQSNLHKNISPVAINPPEYSAVTLMIGKKFEAGTQGDYNNVIPYPTTAAVFYGSETKSNFEFDADHIADLRAGHKYSDNKLDVGSMNGSSDILHLETNLDNTTLNLFTKNNIIPSVKITSSLFKVHEKTTLEKGAIFNKVRYRKNAADNQVLICEDSLGNVIWKNKYEVFGALPIGSIMSIRESDFNNSNFNTDNSVNGNFNGKLEIAYGRGRLNTPFEGWYLCHGSSWELDGVISHKVPRLHTFIYNIETNSIDQDSAQNGGNNDTVVIAGASIDINAAYDNNSKYNVSLIKDTEDINTSFNSSGNSLVSGNMIHLINLGESSLVWQSEIQDEASLESISLSLPQNGSVAACDSSEQVYQWSGIGIDWVNGDVTGTVLYLNAQTAPSNKWYEKDGIARYWKGTYWYSVQGTIVTETCPLANVFKLKKEQDVRNLNWSSNPPLGNDYVLNGSKLNSSTTLKELNGNNAPAGWYREVDTGFTKWMRKYWNGSEFLSEFVDNYIYYLGKITPSSSYTNTTCDISTDNKIDIYYSKINQPMSSGSITNLNYLNAFLQEQVTVLINIGFATNQNNDIGELPLIKIHKEDLGSSNVPTASIIEEHSFGKRFGVIESTSSRVASIVTCQQDNNCVGYEVDNGYSSDVIVNYTRCNGQAASVVIPSPGSATMCSTTIPIADDNRKIIIGITLARCDT